MQVQRIGEYLWWLGIDLQIQKRFIAVSNFTTLIAKPLEKVFQNNLKTILKFFFGIIIDSELSFNHQINKVVKSCFNILRKLSSIRHFLSSEHLKSLVCSYIFSQIDYCNSLYFGINLQFIKKLQHVQNCAACLNAKMVDFSWWNIPRVPLVKS